MTIRIKNLYCYPIKACRGTSLISTTVGRMGIKFDRQWMVVDANTGMFVAQRSDHGMGVGIKSICLVYPEIMANHLVIKAPGMIPVTLPLSGLLGEEMEVQIWQDKVIAVDQGDTAAAFFTKFLGKEKPGDYRLVRMPDKGIRIARHGGADVGFADSDSFLIISDESMKDLNERATEEVLVNQVRPNIVVYGCNPYDEDRMDRIRIGKLEFVGKKLCVRCPTTLINQATGEAGEEPLKTLATYRHRKDLKGVVFGRNFNHQGEGELSVGMTCEVLELAPESH